LEANKSCNYTTIEEVTVRQESRGTAPQPLLTICMPNLSSYLITCLANTF